MTWKYLQNGNMCGPVETAALQALIDNVTLKADTLVLKEGATEWVPLSSQAEFKFASAPMATLSVSGAPPPIAGAGAIDPALDIEQNKIYAILAYVGLLFLVPLLAAPKSSFARYHTNQGIVLFLATLIGEVGAFILMMVPIVGCVAWVLPMAILGMTLVLMILGIIAAGSGEYKPLPFIGHFNILT